MLSAVMKNEDPNKDFNIAFPYWDWIQTRKIPDLFEGFTPKMNVEVYYDYDDQTSVGTKSQIIKDLQVKRFPPPNLSTELPNEAQVTAITRWTNFLDFTNRLEGDRNFNRAPHNYVHGLVGGTNPSPDPAFMEPKIPLNLDGTGTMLNPYISPLDPIFWCHHANIDRIWAGWQKKQIEEGNTGSMHPNLSEEDKKMHPWFPEYVEEQTREIETMGYTYDKL
jgi:hypothetical protein